MTRRRKFLDGFLVVLWVYTYNLLIWVFRALRQLESRDGRAKRSRIAMHLLPLALCLSAWAGGTGMFISHSAVGLQTSHEAATLGGSSSHPVLAATRRSTAIPPGLGWFEVPDTNLRSVCPPNGFGGFGYNFNDSCKGVIRAWSGGIADTKRNRLIIWGGGHNDYYGNEVYAFDLNTLELARLNDPSPVTKCQEGTLDSKANSRHTYGGLAYIAHVDRMFVFSGGWACPNGETTHDTWVLELASLQWTRMDPTRGGHPAGSWGGIVTAYDPSTRLVFVLDRDSFWSYSFDTNSYKLLNANAQNTLHTNAVIDPKRKLFLTFGDERITALGIGPKSNYAQRDWTKATGCAPLANASSPGLAYDPVLDRIVGWPDFGNAVYTFDPDSKSCTAQSFSGGPPDSAHTGSPGSSNGTFGRFQYFPTYGVFVLISDWNVDTYILRLTPRLAASGGNEVRGTIEHANPL